MQDQVIVVLVQFEPRYFESKEENVSYMVNQIMSWGKEGADLIVFPELSVSGFFRHEEGSRRAYWEGGAEDLNGTSTQRIIEAAREAGVYVVYGIAERLHRPVEMYNSAVLVGPEGIIGVTRKVHLPQYEKLYFTPGQPGDVFLTPLGGIGMVICYDMFFPECTRILALKGAELIVAISSVWKGGAKGGIGLLRSKEKLFELTPIMRAMENQVYFLSCNACGSHNMGPILGIWERLGKSKVVDPLGNVLAEAQGETETTVKAILSRDVLINGRAGYTFLADRIPELYKDLTCR